jgi:hypothetical protein
MLSIGLWLWYINITITVLDSIHSPVFYLKRNVSDTEFFRRSKVEYVLLGPIHRPGPETETSSVYWSQLSEFHKKMERESVSEMLCFNNRPELCQLWEEPWSEFYETVADVND